ncbi:expressed protein [Echinococcus multilocularis]|uniref:Expressed protein n=1 Tax=Echinococcus multilocularis TaxID=6211 RepID=A0A068YN23_ECHMU|nr:expressed protein [Echinococcus multilocularis]
MRRRLCLINNCGGSRPERRLLSGAQEASSLSTGIVTLQQRGCTKVQFHQGSMSYERPFFIDLIIANPLPKPSSKEGECHPLQSSGKKDCFTKREQSSLPQNRLQKTCSLIKRECPPPQNAFQKACSPKQGECPPPQSPLQQTHGPRQGQCPPPQNAFQKARGPNRGESLKENAFQMKAQLNINAFEKGALNENRPRVYLHMLACEVYG